MSEKQHLAPMQEWLPGPTSPEVNKALLRLARTEGVLRIAVMPDVHLAEGVCIGTVFSTKDRIFPEAIGTDIGCGMAAMRLDAEPTFLENAANARKLLSGLVRVVPANRHPLGRKADWLPESLSSVPLSHGKLTSAVHHNGRVQFGTLGRGNHFLEIQLAGEGGLWMMVHSGSRGIGQSIAGFHRKHAQRSNTGLLYFEADSHEGQAYLHDASWAMGYAKQSRARMLESATLLLEELYGVRGRLETCFDSVHNFVRLEKHQDHDVYVHRKGANSAGVGEWSIIPGSMGTASYHVSGRGNEDALRSCSHGAGRAMSRIEARTVITEKQLRRDMRGVHYNDTHAGHLCEEAPGAYKEIDGVMRAQSSLVKQERRLLPLLNSRGLILSYSN